MDKPTYVNGPSADAETVADFRDAAASDLDSVRAFAAEGCISGLIPDLAASTVGVGEVIVGGNRARARAAVSIDLAGVTRPASGQFRWVAITAAYSTTTVGGTLTELPSGTQHAAEVQDSIILALVEGVATTTGDSDDAVRPTAPVGTANLCDLLIDHDTALRLAAGSQHQRHAADEVPARSATGPDRPAFRDAGHHRDDGGGGGGKARQGADTERDQHRVFAGGRDLGSGQRAYRRTGDHTIAAPLAADWRQLGDFANDHIHQRYQRALVHGAGR